MAVEKKVRHILSLSGGKDSTALAILMKGRIPDLEYVFCDTKKELPETYEYLDKLEAFLGKKIVRIADERGFDHWLTREERWRQELPALVASPLVHGIPENQTVREVRRERRGDAVRRYPSR